MIENSAELVLIIKHLELDSAAILAFVLQRITMGASTPGFDSDQNDRFVLQVGSHISFDDLRAETSRMLRHGHSLDLALKTLEEQPDEDDLLTT